MLISVMPDVKKWKKFFEKKFFFVTYSFLPDVAMKAVGGVRKCGCKSRSVGYIIYQSQKRWAVDEPSHRCEAVAGPAFF
jgi:hypothetical protein